MSFVSQELRTVLKNIIIRCAPEQTAEQAVEMLVIWDAMALIMTSM